MKKLLTVFASFVMALSLSALFADPFEGVLEGYMDGFGVTNATVEIHLKGNKARMYPKSNMTAATNGLPIIDYDAMKITLLADKEKYYLEMPLDAMEKNLTVNPLTLTPTGKKDKYLGLDIEEFKTKDSQTGIEIVISGTKNISSKLNPLVSFQRLADDGISISKSGRALVDLGYFPVKLQAVKNGKTLVTWEIRKVDVKKIDASELQVPKDYIKFSDYMKKKNKNRGGR